MDRRSHFAIFLFGLALSAFFLSPTVPSLCLAENVTLGWDANPEPDLAGYVIYRNIESPGPPFRHVDELEEDELEDPLHPQVTITGLNRHSRYYIAITAYDTQGNESYFSDQVCVEIVDSLVESCGVILSASSGSSSASSGGSGGGNSEAACFISSSSGLSGQWWIIAGIALIMLFGVSRLLSVARAK